jgi:hypothetical protein
MNGLLTRPWLVFAAALAAAPCWAQEHRSIDPDFACAAEPSDIQRRVLTLPSSEAASRVLWEIIDSVGMSAERWSKIIELREAPDVANAIALISPLTNSPAIFYNVDFIERIRDSSESAWADRAILAHEIAHHLSQHLKAEDREQRISNELEADKFAGNHLYVHGASLAATVAVFEQLGGGGDYPSKKARADAAKNGWIRACERAGDDCSGPPSDMHAAIERLRSYEDFGSYAATREEARQMLRSVGVPRLTGPAVGDYVEGHFENGYCITIWAQTHGKPNAYGVRFGKHEPDWDWESTYFEIIVPERFFDPAECHYELSIACPMAFAAGSEVELNGGWINLDPPCPAVTLAVWDWGDGTVRRHPGRPPAPFPSRHRYQVRGEYAVSVSLLSERDVELDRAECSVTIGSRQ